MHTHTHTLCFQAVKGILGVAEEEEGADFRVSNEDLQGEAMKQPGLSALGPASPWAQIACLLLPCSERVKPSLPFLWAIVLAVLPENFSLKILRSTSSLTPGSSGRLTARPATPRQPQQHTLLIHKPILFSWCTCGPLELPSKAPGCKLPSCRLDCYCSSDFAQSVSKPPRAGAAATQLTVLSPDPRQSLAGRTGREDRHERHAVTGNTRQHNGTLWEVLGVWLPASLGFGG